MPTYYARLTGNVNAANIWATTPSGTAAAVTLTASDVLVSNSFTVTLNVNTTVAQVRNDNVGGATAGGSFTLANGITLTANVFNATTTTAVVNLSGSNSGTIIGNVTSTVAGGAVSQSGSGNLTVVGNVTGGSSQSAHGIASSTAGTVNITGTCTAGTGTSSSGVYWTGSGTLNITGSCVGGNATLFTNGVNTASATGSVNVYGTAVAGDGGYGAANVSSGTLFVQRAKGNGFGNGSVGMASVPGVFASNANSTTRVAEFEFGDLGQTPVGGAILLSDSTSNVVLLYRPSLTKKTLVDPAATVAFPAASDVRLGTSYNSGTQTGTLAVPLASQVAVGVAVDNTTGTAALTPAAVWDAATSGMTAAGSVGERLKNAATVASTGQQLADALAGL